MTALAISGSFCLGAVVGWLIRYFLRRLRSFSSKALGTVVSLIVGLAPGIVFIGSTDYVWTYFIGVALGFVVYHVIASRELEKLAAIRKIPRAGSDEPLFARKSEDQKRD